MVAKEDINNEHPKISLNYVRNDSIQQGDKLTWYLYVKEVIPEFSRVIFNETNCIIIFKTKDAQFIKQYEADEHFFEWNVNLPVTIRPDKCSFKVTKTSIEINLVKVNDIKWPSPFMNPQKSESVKKVVRSRSPSSSPSPPPPVKTKSSSNPGFVGLANLGNTCYMNAALQFLVNATDLRDYFLINKDQFQKEINMSNALGLNGKMAVTFAMLLRQLWTSESSYIVPNRLRELICSKYSNFRGYEQQDTQEFMSSLISLVHEDLNRVTKKPFYEDSLECEDDSLGNCVNIATKSWERFLSRENSIIVDNFYGQFKSKLTCPECNRVSITFEPFSNLLVPVAKPKSPTNFLVSHGQNLVLINLYINEEETIESVLKQFRTKYQEYKETCLKVYVIEKCLNDNDDDDLSGYKFDSYFDNLKNSDKVPSLGKNKHFMISVIEGTTDEQVYEFRIEQICKCPIVNDITTNQCSFCLKMSFDETNNNVNLPRCTLCFRSAYCNRECQTSDWSRHNASTCLKQPDRIGLPFILTMKKSFLKSETFVEDFRSILLERALKSVELTNFDLSKNNNYELEILDSSSMSSQKLKYKKLDPKNMIEIVEKNNKNFLKIFLKWNNSMQNRQLKTNLNSIVDLTQDTEQPGVDLNDCLNLFTQPEKLTSDNPWYCSKCKKHQEATKQMSLWKLPKYLIITLKRFQASKADLDPNSEYSKFMMMNSRFSYLLQNRVVYNKLNHFVDFPLRGLNMTKYIVNKDDGVYDLCGVINHLGQSLSIGHYTAFTRTHDRVDTTQDELGWRLFDDQEVYSVKDERQVVSKDAYVLMYRLRSRPGVDDESKNESESNNVSSESASEGEFYDAESEESTELNEKNNYTNLNELD